MRKFLAGISIAALALVAAGCGDDGGDEGDKAKGSSVSDVKDHDALVALAEKEGKVKVSTSMTEDAIPEIKEAWEAKYPNIELEINEQTGDDDKRILLELQAGTSDIDVLHLSAESYHDTLDYVSDVDLLDLSEKGVLDIPKEMINPAEPDTMAAGSGIGVFSYNPDNLDSSLVPSSWDDFLKPELADKKFLVDIEPANLAILGVAWGEDELLDYAKKIKDQKPIWVRGDTNSITLMGAGEFDLHAFSNYHSAYRAQGKGANVEIGVLEPVPVRLTHIQAISKVSKHQAAAALFIEFTAGPEVQAALDKNEPMQSSIYAGKSSLHDLIEGKETSVLSWENFDKQPEWETKIIEAWGFPTAEVEEKD